MKYFIVLSALMLMTKNLGAQTKYENVEITFGDHDYLTRLDFNIPGSIRTGDGYLMFKKKVKVGPGGYTYTLENWGDNLKKKRDFDISGCFENEKETSFDRFLKIGDEYCMFITRFFPEEEKREVYYYFVNEETCAIGERNLLLSQKSDWGKNYALVTSEDEENLLLATFTTPEMNVEPELRLQIFDENLEEVWNYESVSLANDYPHYRITNIVLGDDGRTYISGYGGYKEEDTTLYGALYTVIDANNDAERTFPLQLADGRIADDLSTQTKFGDGGEVYIMGYFTRNMEYSITRIPYVSEGVFKLQLDPVNGKVISTVYGDFGDEILPDSETRSKRSKDQKRYEMFTGFSVDYIKPLMIFDHPDGSFSFIGVREYMPYDVMNGAQTITIPPDLVISWIPVNGEITHEKHWRLGVSSIFQVKNTICLPKRKRMSQVDCPGLTEKEKKKLKNGVESLEIMSKNAEMRKEYYMDLENPGYDNPFTILWDQKKLIFREEGYTDFLIKTHFGKSKYGWVKIRFL